MAINMIYKDFMGDVDGRERGLAHGADLGSDPEVMMAGGRQGCSGRTGNHQWIGRRRIFRTSIDVYSMAIIITAIAIHVVLGRFMEDLVSL